MVSLAVGRDTVRALLVDASHLRGSGTLTFAATLLRALGDPCPTLSLRMLMASLIRHLRRREAEQGRDEQTRVRIALLWRAYRLAVRRLEPVSSGLRPSYFGNCFCGWCARRYYAAGWVDAMAPAKPPRGGW